MYSVMLVDDEAVLRSGMRTFIPWRELGFQVTAEAENGAKALDRILQGDIDVVFLDIRMPRMSGIDLLEELAKREPNVIPVVLSGYDNFEYARAAVKYKAAEYLLKPVDMDELVPLMRNIRGQLDRRKRQEAEELQLRRQMLESVLHKLAGEQAGLSEDSRDSFVRHFAGYKLRIVAIAGIGPDLGSFKKTAAERLTEILGADMTVCAVSRHFGLLLASVQMDAPHPINIGVRIVEKEELLANIADNAAETVAVGPLLTAEDWIVYVRSAIETGYLERKLFYASGKVMQLELPIPSCTRRRLEPDDKLGTAVTEGIRRNDLQRIRQSMSDLYFSLQANPQYDPDSVRRIYERLLSCAAEAAAVAGGRSFTEENPGLGLSERLPTLSVLHRDMMRRFEEIADRLAAAAKDKKRRIVMETKRFVNERLAEPILLAEIAYKYSISQEYLSVLFKKEEGVNFHVYLRDIRMKRAMELMAADCTLKIYELAQQVGYSDPRHFSKVFKESTGMTPKQYVESL
ncbi:response regulator [Paenibacillus sp. MBLB4367]|uniref:response regulator n=1 Tax=Paenibacillus sp. MBLB4367 TaxID=3384767 RepID=UPI003907F3DE